MSKIANDGDRAGPSSAPLIGPVIPSAARSLNPPDTDEDEDDYTPALPPDMLSVRNPTTVTSRKARIVGPAVPPSLIRNQQALQDDDDDDYGPSPLPAGVTLEERDGVQEFLEKEETRRKKIEEAAKPKALKREEWMLVPPSSSDLLGSIDPTKLTKPRQFARSAAPVRNADNSLWTETPAERQQRVADEVAGKRRRAANADPVDEEAEAEARKRRRRDEDIRRGVEAHTRKVRGGTLLDQHSSGDKKRSSSEEGEGPPVIWDHGRDMALSGRLMDDKSRDKFIKDARGLGDRFGTAKSGGFL